MSPSRVGRYAIVGSLWKGSHEEILVGEQGSRRVVIRLFDVADKEALLEAARRVAGLSQANIAHQEVGLHEERPFLAAELDGMPLETWSGSDHALADQLQVIEGIAAGLAHAHSEGMFHGRLAPARIQVAGDGIARLWGFAVPGCPADRSLERYLAPEVLDDGVATAQSDVYSAGVVFYEILAGEPPTGDAPRPLQELRKDVPKDLADAIMACRERAADWRPKDLDYLLEVVRRTRGDLPTPKPKPAAAPRLESPRPTAPTPARRSGPPFLPIAVVVVLAGAGALYFLSRGGAQTTGAAAPATTSASPAVTTLPAAAAAPTAAPPEASLPAPSLPTATLAVTPTAPTAPPTTLPSATPHPTPAPSLATPPPTSTTTLPPATTLPANVAEPAPSTPPAPPAGPALLRTVSPPGLRRGQRTLVDVRGQNLYPGQGAALLRSGRPAEGLRVIQQRFVNPTLVQVFIEVDAQAVPGPYTLLLSDGQSVTNAVRFDVAK